MASPNADGMGLAGRRGGQPDARAHASGPTRAPIGHYLLYEWDRPERVRIVGVAGDVHDDGPDKQAYMEIYRPHSQFPYSSMALVVRGAGDPAAYATPVRNAIRELDRDLPLATVEPMTALVSRAVGVDAIEHRAVWVVRSARSRARHDRDLRRHDVFRSAAAPRDRHSHRARRVAGATCSGFVVWRGVSLSVAGIAIGVVAALVTSGLMRKLLFGVPPRDAPTFVAIAVLVGAVGVLAAWVPGRRATRVDPVTALRGE